MNHHVARVAPAWREMGFRVGLVVWHPLDRLVGLWKHRVYWRGLQGDETSALLKFPNFVRAVHLDDGHSLPWFYRWTISRPNSSEMIDHLIRFERLQADVDNLVGQPVDIAPEYESAHSDWRPFYTDDMKEIAREWGKEDLGRYYPHHEGIAKCASSASAGFKPLADAL